jgi:nitroreductase
VTRMALLRDPDVCEPELAPLLQDRWSPRAFDPHHELTNDQLHRLLEAARWAPSSGNSQPWSFIVGLRGSETFDAFREYHSRGNTSWTGNASALFIAISQRESGPDHELPWAAYAEYDLGQAASHLTIEAVHLGLHAHQFAGFDQAGVAERFGVPAHWKVMTGIAVGALADPEVLGQHGAAREREPRARRPISEFAFTGRWGESPISFA